MGLMGRAGLPDGAGLWLPGGNGIHMMFMRFPIDCVFLGRAAPDGAREVVAVRRALPPWRGIVWYVRGAHGTLELPIGTLDRTGTARRRSGSARGRRRGALTRDGMVPDTSPVIGRWQDRAMATPRRPRRPHPRPGPAGDMPRLRS